MSFYLPSILITTDYRDLSDWAASLDCKIFTEWIWSGIQNPIRTKGMDIRSFYSMILISYKTMDEFEANSGCDAIPRNLISDRNQGCYRHNIDAQALI